MNIVFDTDILSCIAKIKGFDFIKEVFPKSEYIVPGRVYEEILKAKKYGYDFSAYIIDLIDESVLSIPNLTAEEGQKIRDLEFTNLHFGEIEAMVLSMRQNSILLSNDYVVKKKAKEFGIDIFNLEDILAYSIEIGAISESRELIGMIREIESRDRIKIKNKEYLFNKIHEKNPEH